MYNLSVFMKRGYGDGLGLFQEADIIAFTEPFLESLAPLINTAIGEELNNFYKRAETVLSGANDYIAVALRKKIDLMHKVLDERVKNVTLPVEYEKSGILRKLWYMPTTDIQSMGKADLDELISEMESVKSNIFSCAYKIPPRTRDEFDRFFVECKNLVFQVQHLVAEMAMHGVELNSTPDLLLWIKNKDHNIFYKPREKETLFNIRGYQIGVQQLERRLEGAKYRKFCLDEGTMLRKVRYIKLQ